MSNPPGVKIMAKAIQKPPYDESAVAPKVFPTAISHIPAKSWTRPPYAKAEPTTRFGTVIERVRMLIRERRKVVRANPHKPRGAGFANCLKLTLCGCGLSSAPDGPTMPEPVE